jgi:DhnA family fructose-bisphosphate aldolase class Ia
MLDDARYRELLDVRARHPERIAHAAQQRRRRPLLRADGALFLVAADHPARGALGVGDDPTAMADRRSLLDRLLVALAHPRVDGVLATPDIVEDLVLLGALDEKVVIGSMNRGGLAGTVFELDDRFTAYDADAVAAAGLDGGKMLLRLDDADYGTLPTIAACAAAVTALATHGLMAMVEPLPYRRTSDGRARLDLDTDRMVRAVAVASGLGATSAYTWLKLPATADVNRVAAASTLPVLLLGGDPWPDPAATFAGWAKALDEPSVRGLVAGRALLYPSEGGPVAEAVHIAVDAAAQLLPAPIHEMTEVLS